MSAEETHRIELADCVMVIAVEQDELVERIAVALSLMPVRCRDTRQARERMLATRPLVVVLGGEPTAEDLSALEDVTVALGTQVVVLRDVDVNDAAKLDSHLKAALQKARRRRSSEAPSG